VITRQPALRMQIACAQSLTFWKLQPMKQEAPMQQPKKALQESDLIRGCSHEE
jgi:hypothetical protein